MSLNLFAGQSLDEALLAMRNVKLIMLALTFRFPCDLWGGSSIQHFKLGHYSPNI